ncbi:SprB repeat-containing protein [Flavobacterium sp. LS1R49]|uniref:SprB repeat-containing protein n=1 Tax=Flavobacterium shii TaxID=2987687 RepID=A0A9X2ZDL2_9FLAO|nr:SprB repeat-containing protein [Flavobacterium shii]MCV9926826.1 SprB repeat-containing protein [Flavobacterium shii]
MEKKLLILLFFFISIVLQGQTKYGILVETALDPFLGWGGSHGGSHSIRVGNNAIYKSSNSQDVVVTEYDFFYVTAPYPSVITCTGGTTGNIDVPDCRQSSTIPYDPNTFDRSSFSGCIAYSKIMGIYLPQPVNSNACKEDVITFNRGWNWQYSYDGSNWVNFTSEFQAQRNISFKIKDLSGSEGKLKIYFRTGYVSINGSKFTDQIVYDIIPCSPGLVGTPNKTNLSCNNGNNGQVTFTFDRDLIQNESFLLNLTQIVNGNNLPPITKNVSIADFPNRQITFTGLASGTYFLHYQTFLNNGSNPTSDNTDNPFFIDQPTPLKFIITPTNPSCNGGNGEILINTSGGTPPYFYSINNGTKIQFANGSPIIPAPNGLYSIKITDSNGCIEK